VLRARKHGEDQAIRLLEAAAKTLRLWREEIAFGELADDIAVEAHLALQLTKETEEPDPVRSDSLFPEMTNQVRRQVDLREPNLLSPGR
jgi:hypothetical protein